MMTYNKNEQHLSNNSNTSTNVAENQVYYGGHDQTTTQNGVGGSNENNSSQNVQFINKIKFFSMYYYD